MGGKAQVDSMEVQEAASRLLACPRLSREREAERQRAIQRPLDVSWHEKIEENGQVYISISSEEEEEEEEDDEEEEEEQAKTKQISLVSDVKREFTPSQPEVVTIDSSSEDEEEAPYEAEEEEEEEPVSVKRKLEVLELDEEEEEQKEEKEEEDKEEPVVDVAVVEKQQQKKKKKKKKQQRQVATRQNVVWEQHNVSGVRKRRLGEEDAAFLLFYGDRETPSANILRLIVGACGC